jgi:hypothetical protein
MGSLNFGYMNVAPSREGATVDCEQIAGRRVPQALSFREKTLGNVVKKLSLR